MTMDWKTVVSLINRFIKEQIQTMELLEVLSRMCYCPVNLKTMTTRIRAAI